MLWSIPSTSGEVSLVRERPKKCPTGTGVEGICEPIPK